MASKDKIDEIISMLAELEVDATVPKNVKLKVREVIKTLKEDKESSIKVNEALNDLDEIADDTNVQPYTRTQLYGVVSLLEKVKD